MEVSPLRPAGVLFAVLTALLGLVGAEARGQILINEVIADNGDVPPVDINCGTPDMLELYNDSDDVILLGQPADEDSYYLSDTLSFDVDPETGFPTAWRFPDGMSVIQPRSFLLVFCDQSITQGACELHANFQIAQDGSEALTLWGPEDPVTGERPVVDRVWLPPLRRNVSFGRLPDGGGGANVPLEETLSVFRFFDLDSDTPPTFGGCRPVFPGTQLCQQLFGDNRICGVTIVDDEGNEISPSNEQNPSGSNLEPRVERETHTTNSPGPDEPVEFTVRVRDEKDPRPVSAGGSIELVELIYRVGGGTPETIPMEYDAATGILDDCIVNPPRCQPDPPPGTNPPQRLDRWTLWSATIPGQSAGSRVEFHFRVRDSEGAESTSPRPLCPDDVGPCDREFGGYRGGPSIAPGCMRDEDDETCVGDDGEDGEGGTGGGCGATGVIGERYLECDAWFTYASGYEPSGLLASVVINEVVPLQDGLLADLTQEDCRISDQCPERDTNCCPPEDPDCCKKREDFVELFNASNETVMLEGCWLSDRFFRPRGWQFPQGSRIEPGEHLIIWIDNDGGKCPEPTRTDPPCFWECLDPTNPLTQEYHTNFALNFGGDQIFLFDTEENNFGLIHGLDYPVSRGVEMAVNRSIALFPDGDRNGCFAVTDQPTPREANPGDCPGTDFVRGDADSSSDINLTDGVKTLGWLFLGAVEPECLDAADANDDGSVNLTDAVFTFTWLFSGGMEPPPPTPSEGAYPEEDCGQDPTEDAGAEGGDLGCQEPAARCAS